MEGKDASVEAGGRREEPVIGKWRKGDLVIKWQRTWQNRVLLFRWWKVEFASNKTSKQDVKNTALFLLSVYNECERRH